MGPFPSPKEPRTCLKNREPVVSPTQEIIFHSCSVIHCLDHNGHPRPRARRWYHAPVGVLPWGGWPCRQGTQCGRSRVGEEGDARVNSDRQSGVCTNRVFSAFICVDAFLQAEFPLFWSSLQNTDTPVLTCNAQIQNFNK